MKLDFNTVLHFFFSIESISKFEELVKLYLKSESLALNESSRIESIRGDSSLIFRSKPQCRSFILDHLKQDGSVNRATFPFAMEGLRKAQYQTFFTIKVFCSYIVVFSLTVLLISSSLFF